MSEVTHLEGPDGRSATFEPSPINYFPNDPDLHAIRLTIKSYGDPVFFHDFVIHENTRYVLYLEAMPNYRDGKWLEHINFVGGPVWQQAMEIYGNYEKEVFLNVGSHSIPSVIEGLKKRADLTERDLLLASKIHMTGALMTIVDTGNLPENIV